MKVGPYLPPPPEDVSGLMFVMRHFAGPLVHRWSSIGLLWISCLMGSLGLVALSFASSPVTGLLAATGLGDPIEIPRWIRRRRL